MNIAFCNKKGASSTVYAELETKCLFSSKPLNSLASSQWIVGVCVGGPCLFYPQLTTAALRDLNHFSFDFTSRNVTCRSASQAKAAPWSTIGLISSEYKVLSKGPGSFPSLAAFQYVGYVLFDWKTDKCQFLLQAKVYWFPICVSLNSMDAVLIRD